MLKNLRNVASWQVQIEIPLESLRWGLVRSLKTIALLGEKRLGQLGLREAGSMSFLANRLLRNMVNTQDKLFPKHRGIQASVLNTVVSKCGLSFVFCSLHPPPHAGPEAELQALVMLSKCSATELFPF